ncbi:MAG: LysR family transcriptional regulator [Myxococcales bacterium]|nr:LysR family transcriptional regulator [Myxococcales bacterium]
MNGTISLEDMRLFGEVAAAESMTVAARRLGMPKQTVSRRVAELERVLGVQLLHRTTRRVRVSEVGAVYAARCAEIARIAGEANRAVRDARETPSGTLRITADPVFGDAFVGGLVIEYARRWPEVRVDVVLTRRRVDLVEEGFDVAFRVGVVDEASLGGFCLGPARVRYCASPAYLEKRGAPAGPEELARHDCIVVASEGAQNRWPFASRTGLRLVPVPERLRVTSFAMAHAAALAGLGIGIFPEFACAEDVRGGRLVPVLDAHRTEVGGVWVLYPGRRFLPTRVRAFVEMTRERFSRDPAVAAAVPPKNPRKSMPKHRSK